MAGNVALHDAAAGAAAAHGASGPNVGAVVILLAAAVIAVPLFRRIGLGSVLGYLAAGLAIGPFGFGFFHDALAILHVAELGVVLFLFVIGLEMQPSRLWSMRGEIFGLGAMQVCLAIAVLTCVGLVLGFSVPQSFVAGTGFVLTSTAIVMQVLDERGEMALPRGRRMIAILLFEDLAIVPLLALVAFLAPGQPDATLAERFMNIAIGLGCIGALVLAGRYLLDPMFRLLARSGAREVMTAAALLVALGSALLMQAGGLSMAMGAFLAGVLLSESTFRHQLEADIEPFRGLLLGLFFLGVGMALDLNIIVTNWALIAICVPAYMILKMLVIFVVARLTGADNSESVERAVLMAQGGEFAFVLYASATQFGIIDAEANATLTAIIIVSMVLTPLMMILMERLRGETEQSLDGVEAPENLTAPVLMIGFGRFNQIVSQPILAQGIPLSIIEIDPQAIRDSSEFGFKVWYGDGSRLDVLRTAGAANASLIIVGVSDRHAASRIVELVKQEFPLVPVIARAYDRLHARELVDLNVDFQIRETFGSAISMAHEALERLGNTSEQADDAIAEFRERDKDRFELEVVSGTVEAGRGLLLGNVPQDGSVQIGH